MSGCGVWMLFGGPSAPTHPPRLAGIFTEWHTGTKGYLVATKIRVAIEVIAREFPELRPSLGIMGLV